MVLDRTSTLNRCVDTYTDDAEAEEEEHGDPFEHCYTSAFALNFGHSLVLTVFTEHFLGAFPGSFLGNLLQSHRFILDVCQVNLLNRSVLPVRDLFT